jgi:hypothetical protein
LLNCCCYEELALANPRSNKRDIAQAKREKAALKRTRRQHSDAESVDSPASRGAAAAPGSSEGDVLDALGVLHGRFAAGDVSFDEFEALKVELLDRLAP